MGSPNSILPFEQEIGESESKTNTNITPQVHRAAEIMDVHGNGHARTRQMLSLVKAYVPATVCRPHHVSWWYESRGLTVTVARSFVRRRNSALAVIIARCYYASSYR